MREQKTFIINTMSEDRYRILSAKLPSNQLHIVDDRSSSGRTVLASYDLVQQKHDNAIKAIQENINGLELKYDLSTCQIQLIGNEQIITTFDAKPFISDNYLSGAEFIDDKLNLHIARYVSSGISSYIDENGETVVKELSGIISVNVISVDFPIEHEWTDSLSSSQSPIQASAIYMTVTDISDAVALSAAGMSAATALSVAEMSDAVALSVAGMSAATALSVAEMSSAIALSVAEMSSAVALSVAEMSDAIALSVAGMSAATALSVAEMSDAISLSVAGMSAAVALSVAEMSDAIALSVAGMSAATALSVDTMSSHIALSVGNLRTDVDTMSSHIAISVDAMSVHVALSVDNMSQDITNKVKVGDFGKELSAVDELSVVRIDAEEYYKLAKQRKLDPTTVYILSGEYFNAYNMPIKNLGDPVSANDAVNLKNLSAVSSTIALSVTEMSDAIALSVAGISNAVHLSVAEMSDAIALSVFEMSTAVALSASRLETKITNISDAVALSVNMMSSHIAMSVDCLSNYIAGLDQSYTAGSYQIFNTIEQKNGRISANFKPLNLDAISGMRALQISVQTNTGNITTLNQQLGSEITNRAADDGYLSGQIDSIVGTLIPGAVTSANTYTDNQLEKLSLSRPSLANKLITETDIAKFDQIMHFVGTITEAEPNPISSTSYTAWGDNQYKPGDVQVSIKSGKEFVFLSSNSTASTEYRWEVIGDQNTYLPKTSYDSWKSTVILSVAEMSDAIALSAAGMSAATALSVAEISAATALSVAGMSTAVALSVAEMSSAIALSVAGMSAATALSVAGMSSAVALSVAGMSAATALSVDTMSAHVALSVDNLNYDIVNKIKAGDFGDELSNVNELSVVRIDAKEYYKLAKQRKLDPTTIYLLSNDCFNAYNMPIKNLGDPVSANDAVNLKKLSTVSSTVALSVTGISAATALSVAGISAATALSVAGMSSAIALSVDTMSSHIALSVDNLNYDIVNKIKAGDFGNELSAVDELSVVRIDAEEYYKRAKQRQLDPTTVYILSAEDYNVYNRKIINLKDPEADTDAVNLRYVSRVETKFTNFMTDLSNDLHPILSSRSIDFGALSGAVYSIYDQVLKYFNN